MARTEPRISQKAKPKRAPDQPQGKTLDTSSARAMKASREFDAERAEDAEEGHPRAPHRKSGTLPTVSDSDRLPVTEPGLSVDPEDLGRQFLRDATEQDNFESSIRPVEVDEDAVPVGSVISEGSLRASSQEDAEIPVSGALDHTGDVDAERSPMDEELPRRRASRRAKR